MMRLAAPLYPLKVIITIAIMARLSFIGATMIYSYYSIGG
jgi:hypothetical protein